MDKKNEERVRRGGSLKLERWPRGWREGHSQERREGRREREKNRKKEKNVEKNKEREGGEGRGGGERERNSLNFFVAV